MKKLKTISLKGREYVQVSERVLAFNETYPNGMITAKPTFNDKTVYFIAEIFPDSKDKERYFTGHSFGILGAEKALEKLETVAVGRALAFMGIGIVESIASSDEMANFHNKNFNPEIEKSPTCSVCGSVGIKSPKSGRWYCKEWKLHKENNEKFEMIHKPEFTEQEQTFIDSMPNN